MAGTLQSLGRIGQDPQMANRIVQALIESTSGGAAPAPSIDPQLLRLIASAMGQSLPADRMDSFPPAGYQRQPQLMSPLGLPDVDRAGLTRDALYGAGEDAVRAEMVAGPGGIPIRGLNRAGLSGGRVSNLPDARLFIENALKNESRLATTPKEAVREQFEGMRDKLLGGGTTFKIPPEVKNLVKEEGYLGFDTVGEVAQSILQHFDFAHRWEIPSKFVPQLKKWREMVLRENPEILAREFKTRKSIMKGSKRFPGVGSD